MSRKLLLAAIASIFFKSMKSVWLQTWVLVLALAVTGRADIVYNVSRTVGTGSVSGFIQTDGHIGTLATADVTDWNLLLTVGTNTFRLTGPLSGGNSFVSVATSADLTATATNLTFNFSATDSGYFLIQANSPGFGSGDHYYCDGASNEDFFCGPWEIVDPASVNDNPQTYETMTHTGNVIIGSVGGGTSQNPTDSDLYGLNNDAITGPSPCTSGDPVKCATGNLVETTTDLTVQGRGRFLHLVRTYNGLDAASAATADAAGFGWTHSYAEFLSFDGSGNPTVHQGNGSTVPFIAGGSSFTAPPYVIATLVLNGNGTYTFTLPDQRADNFSSTGQLLVQTDRNGYQTSLAYDGSGHLLSVTDPAGRTLSFTYGRNGLVSSVTDPIGRSVSYTHDASQNLIAVTDAAGNITQYTYDGSHRLLTTTDPNGGISSNTYDASNRVVAQTDPAGRNMTFAYTGGTTTITDGNGNVVSQTYTGNRLVSITSGFGTAIAATSTFAYDAAGNRISITDPNGHTWTATYDSHGNQLTRTDSLSRTTTSTYDAQNNLLTRTDPLDVQTTLTYDAHGNLTTVSRPLTGTSQTSTTTYKHGDASHPGDVTAVVDALGQTWSRSYDANGDLNRQVDPDGDTWTGTYNGIGWLTKQVTPRGHATGADPANYTLTRAYSPLGELLKSTDQLGNGTTFTYDGNRNMLSETDALGHTTYFAYDPDNEQTTVTRADGSVLTTTFDAGGNVIGQTDGLGRTTSYAFDALNRLVQTTDPLGRQTQYSYDGAGNPTTLIDAAGQTTSYAYDAANERTAVSYSDGKTPAVSLTYDADGQRTGMTDGTGASTYQYDSLHRLTRSTDGAGHQVSYGYDLRGDLTGLTYPSGKQVTHGFDPAGRLASVKDWLGHTSSFAYDPDGDHTGTTYPNGIKGAFDYDQTDRVVTMSYIGGSSSQGGGPTLMSFDYTRNSLGQVSAVSTGGPAETTSYSYTPINQLSEDNKAPFTYDHADDLVQLSKTDITYDIANEAVTESGGGASSLVYDVRGNRIQQTGHSPQSYGYDQANRLIAFGSHATYAYDGTGLRSGKVVNGTPQSFAWDLAEGMPLLLADGTSQFIYGPNGQPLEQIASNGTVLWFHQDQLGSTRALTNSSGVLAARYGFSPYGQRPGDDPGDKGAAAITPLLFARQYTDAESGLQYMRARYYDPSAGQFLTRDPLNLVTRSPYLYASGDPVNRTDATGAYDESADAGTGGGDAGSSGGGGTCPAPDPVQVAGVDLKDMLLRSNGITGPIYSTIQYLLPSTPDPNTVLADAALVQGAAGDSSGDKGIQKLIIDLQTLVTDPTQNPKSDAYNNKVQQILHDNADAYQRVNNLKNDLGGGSAKRG
jgi:RHS repeat-associated protein